MAENTKVKVDGLFPSSHVAKGALSFRNKVVSDSSFSTPSADPGDVAPRTKSIQKKKDPQGETVKLLCLEKFACMNLA